MKHFCHNNEVLRPVTVIKHSQYQISPAFIKQFCKLNVQVGKKTWPVNYALLRRAHRQENADA
jgi:hypothetical protein